MESHSYHQADLSVLADLWPGQDVLKNLSVCTYSGADNPQPDRLGLAGQYL